MRTPPGSTPAFVIALIIAGTVGACRLPRAVENPSEVFPNAASKANVTPDPAYVANCKALQDSARRYEGTPVYLWKDVDTDVKQRKSDDMPRFDDREFGPGRVKAYFIVGPPGRAETHFIRITYATRPALETSVRRFLARAVYKPAMIGGTPVRVCVTQDFYFRLGN